ncbi:MAG: 3-mercaptopyruvate sulfurtransferase [Hyphomonadaceae bacterium]|nr:3-mercaptopyruvate sulfurtransferase [Hyphomonadaceae bacterium]
MPDQNDPIVSCEWLAERLEAPDVRIVDATWFIPGDLRDARALYEERRIPGAVFFDIDEIADRQTSLPHMLPPPAEFAARVRRMGIGDGSRIVVYDSVGIFSAARVWWSFRVMGHEDVVVLDGGFPAWERAKLPIESGPQTVRRERHFTPRVRADLVRNLADMRRATAAANVAILDARPAPRFRGEVAEPRPGLRSGHMPGASNVPASTLLNEDGRLKTETELREMLALHAIENQPVVCTCGSGITAAIVALALARIGRWDAALYDGSWAEWGALPDTPMETGP